jgi:hypothetical protein
VAGAFVDCEGDEVGGGHCVGRWLEHGLDRLRTHVLHVGRLTVDGLGDDGRVLCGRVVDCLIYRFSG